MASSKEIKVNTDRANNIERQLFPYFYNDGIHALASTSTGSLYVGNGLAQLYKYLDIESANVSEGWTPAPEDVGLSTTTVQHFIFHIQDYIFDNYAHLVHRYGAVNGNNYDKCLALVNQSDSYIYLDYDAYYNGKVEHKVLHDTLLPALFFKDNAEKLCYDYNISIGDLDKVDMYIHQFYLSITPQIYYNTVGCSIGADMSIEMEDA